MVLKCRNVVVLLLGCCYTVSEVLVASERGCVASMVLLQYAVAKVLVVSECDYVFPKMLLYRG